MTFCLRLLGHCITILSLMLLFLPACGTEDAGGDNSQDQPVIRGEASVESIEILILESFPVQVRVRVRGNLPDGCTKIDRISRGSNLEDYTLWVEITTIRPRDRACTEALVSFEEIVPLDVYGLPAGTYTVDVNGVTDTFTLSVDNVPQQSSTGKSPKG